MLNDGILCDVAFLRDDRTTRVQAHRIVLCSSSDYFYAMFTNKLSESNKDEIEISNFDGFTLKSVIDFIYKGKIRFYKL